MIWQDQKSLFLEKFADFNAYKQRGLCAMGAIKEYKQHLQLRLKSPEDLLVE